MKKDINQCNQQGERHGYWETFHLNGNILYKSNYINGELNGLWEWYNEDGKLIEQIFYT